ncbi:DUF551 domain-containing protein [Klebsiella michiganensis]|uniref:DUF551 domain-containing protein n=2 Tax=Klebsiella TaxID=570 RepID=UPI001CCA6246|nr:DUF551 domain-containing protein [Klebsiella michiganensis]
MTKSTITDERVTSVIERLEHYACNLKWTNVRGAQDLLTAADGLRELHERRKAERDTEPYGFTDGDRRGMIYKPEHADRLSEPVPLYRHAQPAPEYPEVLPCSVFLEPGLRFGKGVKTRLVLEAIQRRAEHYAELEAMTPEERAEYDAGIEAFKAMLPQPVPDNSAITQHFDTIALETAREIMCDVNRRHEFLGGEIQLLSRIQCRIDDACRAAILQAEPVTAANKLGKSPVIPDGLPDGVNIYHGPKEKTILVLKQDAAVNQDCWCRTCRPVDLNDMRFVVCPDCGNKRCPRANDHRNACSGSNEPGQEGSAYPDTQQSPGGEPATVPGKWIPVSEEMPEREVDVQVYCPDKKEQMVAYLERNELEGYFRFATWRTGDGIYCQPTHWMQLPAGPKEVKGE